MTTKFASDFQEQARPELIDEHGETGTYTTRAGAATAALNLLVHRHGTEWVGHEHSAAEVERATVHVAIADLATPQRNGYFTTGAGASAETWYVQTWRTRAGDHVCDCTNEHVAERLHAPSSQHEEW
ncbi:MAG TPA: hypothetical protein VM695_09435 [Phycisphaerae bacterium]|nr:hypothetical protein [Phycisphaerae bacterium]